MKLLSLGVMIPFAAPYFTFNPAASRVPVASSTLHFSLLVAHIGFAFLVLSLLWIFTCWKGYRAAVRKRFGEHREWMIRSFGITLVAVSARLMVPVLLLTYFILHGFSLQGGREVIVEEALNVNIWVGIIVNLMIVEWVILKRGT
jgi:hypothetical protein